jgi:ribosomal protein S18 acetylase RimI-like enzyme
MDVIRRQQQTDSVGVTLPRPCAAQVAALLEVEKQSEGGYDEEERHTGDNGQGQQRRVRCGALADSQMCAQQVGVLGDTPSGYHGRDSGHHLVHLFVEPNHQNVGLGRHLLAQGEAMIAAGGRTFFQLHARDADALRPEPRLR